jgi:hypothetical protein
MNPVRRWLVPGLGVALLAAAAWFTPGLWLRLDGWVQNQRDHVWEQFESLVGRKVVYDRIAPNVLAALDFQNVRLLADDGTPVLTAASIRLSLDWWKVLEGKGADSLRRVQVINASANLDDRRDRALLEHWASFVRPGGKTAFGYEVEGFNLTARWTDGLQTIALDRTFVVLTPENAQWGLRFRGALAWRDKGAGTAASLSVKGNLRSDAGFQNWSLRTEASQVRTSWFDLEPLTLQITLSPDQMTLAKVADRIPFDLQAIWDRARNQWSFRGAADGFKPSRVVRLKGAPAWSGLAEGTVSGKFFYQVGGDFSFDGRGDWPEGTWPAPLAADPVAASGSVRTVGGQYHFEGFRIETPKLSALFDGSVDRDLKYPEGTLKLERWLLPGVGEAKGTVAVTRDGSRIAFVANPLEWNSVVSDGLSGWVERAGSGWTFSVGGPVGSAENRFSAAGSFDASVPRFDATVAVSAMPVALVGEEAQRYLPALVLPPALATASFDAEAEVAWSPEGTEVRGARYSFRDPGHPSRSLRGTADWKADVLSVAVESLTWDGVTASGSATAHWASDAWDWSLSARAWDRNLSLQGRWVPSDRTLVFSGTPALEGSLHQNDSGTWSARLNVQPYEVVPGWKAGFLGGATYTDGAWTVAAEKVTVSGRYPWNNEPFSAAGALTADPGFLRLDGLVVSDSRGALTGSAVSSWSADWSEPWAGRLTVATAETRRESLVVDWVGTAVDRWHASVRMAGVDLTRLPETAVQGRLALSGTFDWSGADAQWNAQAALSEARWGDSPVGFRASVSGTATSLAVRALNLSVNSLRVTDGSGDVDARARTWKAQLGVGVRLGASDWQSVWLTTGTWSPPGQAFRTDFTLKTQRNSWQAKTFSDSSLTGSWGAEGWRAALDDGALSARGTLDGAFQLHAQPPFPVKADATGLWSSSTFSATVKGFQADLGLVKEFVNSPLFSLDQGNVSGDFALGGAPADPEVNGRLTLRGLTMRSSFLRRPVGPVEVPVVFEGHQVRIDPVNVGPDGQTWLVSGLARLDHLLPEEFQFTVQTDPLSVIPVSYQYTGLSASGGVSGLLVVKGTPLAVTLGGRLVLQDTTITLRQSQPSSESGLGFNADLTLVTGRKVEFLWPNETLPLLRAVTASNQTLVIRANDVASTWSVTGKLALRTGEINYLSRTFVLKEGQLGFQEGQNGFDPRISVRAEYKVRETTGDVVVNLRADGTLSRFSPRFDATPYRSPDDLQRLVGSTLSLPTDYSKATSLDTAVSLASDVGTSFLLTPFEETVKKNFQLDLFTVKTEILKKSLLSRNGPLEASDYLDNTRLFFGKYIGDDLFLQGTLAFRRDGSVATQVSPKMVVEPEFQMEFQTPFFLLNWTLLPLHPETLFVTDNTVTFRWNWSY